MIGTYVDSGILVKAYCLELNSPDAIALILAERPPLPLTYLQETEVRHALRLKVFRREMTLPALRGALALLDEDIREGRLERPRYDAFSVYRRAEILSSLYSATTGARTLDILHIAAALELGVGRFISFDQRQRSIAKKAGLKVLPKAVVVRE